MPEKKAERGESVDHGGRIFPHRANRLTDLLSTYTPEGLCYRVDLRLRPRRPLWRSLPVARRREAILCDAGRDWELQMLIKARVAAGDPRPGRELLDFVEPLIYKTTTDFRAVEAVSETRARIHEKPASQRGARGQGST